ncbi:MAG: Rieske 2Fe-2S domain-containing protein [Methylococcaceae bacterium]|jgi:Ferredoxin subunits of nitrite reductase and ring-hydroxylating dioxygenases
MFSKACDLSELKEGKYDIAAVNRVLVLLVWATGSEQPRAFQGMCPHDYEPLADARFDGTTVTCRHHDWAFNGVTGACIKGQPCTLAEYPLKIEGDEILVDTDGVVPNRV